MSVMQFYMSSGPLGADATVEVRTNDDQTLADLVVVTNSANAGDSATLTVNPPTGEPTIVTAAPGETKTVAIDPPLDWDVDAGDFAYMALRLDT